MRIANMKIPLVSRSWRQADVHTIPENCDRKKRVSIIDFFVLCVMRS